MKRFYHSTPTNLHSNPTKIAAAGAAVALALAMGGSAQGASDTGTAVVDVVLPIAIVAGADLNFGTVAPGLATTGDTTFEVDATLAAGSPVVVGPGTAFGATASAGVFTVSGAGTSAYDITITGSPVTLTPNVVVGPSLSATIDEFRSANAGLTTAGLSGASALVGGADTITVGGTLTVPELTLQDGYTGSYTMTVGYQ
ncbi:MAG: DUF4402 domain-containing protein [Alphaproteobacteria bacterium]|nr:DUF4402 domain-containing protein [Alphaproteobacteria bacterium]